MARSKGIIVDVDGTIAICGDRDIFDGTQCDELDHPNVPVLKCVEAMARDGYSVVFCSGREDKWEPQTRRFIQKHLPWLEYELFMRKSGDYRKDAIVKEEIYRGKIEDRYEIAFCLDDRDQVVNQWRAMGLTCFQVAPGSS